MGMSRIPAGVPNGGRFTAGERDEVHLATPPHPPELNPFAALEAADLPRIYSPMASGRKSEPR